MAFYNKIGVLIQNEARDRFLVCEKDAGNVTSDYIMPGGQFTEETVEECIKNELKEELGVEVNLKNLTFINEYIDIAAGHTDRDVSIRLYTGVKLDRTPTPQTEIKQLHWINASDIENIRVSPIIRNKIIPDLLQRGLLK